jgi:hypothetical protein
MSVPVSTVPCRTTNRLGSLLSHLDNGHPPTCYGNITGLPSTTKLVKNTGTLNCLTIDGLQLSICISLLAIPRTKLMGSLTPRPLATTYPVVLAIRFTPHIQSIMPAVDIVGAIKVVCLFPCVSVSSKVQYSPLRSLPHTSQVLTANPNKVT